MQDLNEQQEDKAQGEPHDADEGPQEEPRVHGIGLGHVVEREGGNDARSAPCIIGKVLRMHLHEAPLLGDDHEGVVEDEHEEQAHQDKDVPGCQPQAHGTDETEQV